MSPKVRKKIKKIKHRKGNAGPGGASGDVAMTGTGGLSTKRAVKSGQDKPGVESAHDLKNRQAGEWKALRKELALLKQHRKKLPKKSSKDEKKSVSREITKRMDEMLERHERERKAMGVEGSSVVGDDGAASEDAMSEDL
eukprot:TRINITY_DN12484_c0_g1_i1.p1 TRINITY_DN12484_c0_g1~~TRINITY_DN12484_c0_g1_i1.p1  ORF type:complete len:140 (+),score=41.26 TRINITY_DN12484_c0_g1_i1:29-448(+)